MWLILIALIIMLIGIAGSVLPFLPGIPLVFIAYFLYGVLTHWQVYSVWSVLVVLALTIISLLADYMALAWKVKKYQASRSGLWGSLLGLAFGVVVLGPLGIVLGPLFGAFIGELIDGKPHPLAMKISWRGLAGLIAGGFVKIIIGFIIIGLFLWQVSL